MRLLTNYKFKSYTTNFQMPSKETNYEYSQDFHIPPLLNNKYFYRHIHKT